MIVTPEDVPDAVLLAYMEARPDDEGSDEGQRQALAAAITAWEQHSGDARPHQCRWEVLGMQHRTLMTIPQTDVLMRCEGCGDLKNQALTGTWDQADLASRRVAGALED